MSTRRIDAGVSSQLNPFGPQWPTSKNVDDIPSVGDQVKQALFARARPTLLDPAKFPELAAQLKLLSKYKKKLSELAGDEDGDYELVLADGANAQIDENGVIYMGADFLTANQNKPEVLIGALAHEIGHKPKRWSEYKVRRELSREDLEALCRHEETRADIFAGKALAEMDLECEPLIAFLKAVETGPHPEYFPADVRASVIRDAHTSRAYARESRKKLFPEFERHKGAKGFLGEY